MKERLFQTLRYKETSLLFAGPSLSEASALIKAVRRPLESEIRRRSDFLTSLTPLESDKDTPEELLDLYEAARIAGTGPMAGVAGWTAEQMALKSDHNSECIINNGGDIFVRLTSPLTVGLYGGKSLPPNLGFAIEPETTPMALCSSSSRMGHSLSLGSADLVTVAAKNGALADCVATAAANRIHSESDIKPVLNWIEKLPGIDGALCSVEGKIGLTGSLPQLVQTADPQIKMKISRWQ